MAVEKNIPKAKELYHYTCDELGFPDSCFALGNLYLTQKSKDHCEEFQNFSLNIHEPYMYCGTERKGLETDRKHSFLETSRRRRHWVKICNIL